MARKAGLTVDDIVDAAVLLADQQGFHELTLAGVAAELGVQPPSLYHHIEGLDAIRREVARRAIDAFAVTTVAVRDGLHGPEAFRAHAEGQRRLAHEHPGLYAAVNATRYIADDEEMWAALLAAIEPITETLHELGLDGDASWEALRLFRAAVHGFLVLELRGDFGLDVDVDESFQRLIDVTLAGLRSELS